MKKGSRRSPGVALKIWDENGLIPDAVAAAGLDFLEEWLRARLQGSDPNQPVDIRVDEDPEARVADFLRRIGTHHDAHRDMGLVVLRLLEKGRREVAQKGSVPLFVVPLIRLCELVPLPQTTAWFSKEVRRIAKGPQDRSEPGIDRNILHAAVTQKAGTSSDWKLLLANPEYASIAFMALGTTFVDQLNYIAPWWRAVERDEGKRELEYLLRTWFREEPESEIRSTLRGRALGMPQDLRQTIDAWANERFGRAIFSSIERSRKSAIFLAALRPEFVLQRVA